MRNEKTGYAWLKEHFDLTPVFLETESVIARIASVNKEDAACHYYPVSYQPKDDAIEHLTFALKYELLNLPCLSGVFKQAPIKMAIEDALRSSPTGKYNRLMGFYFEMLTGRVLEVPDLSAGNYLNAVDERQYYVVPAVREKKFRINNNLVGSGRLSFLIKRNDALLSNEELKQLSLQSCSDYPIALLDRATRYLISIETKSSNQIESESLSPSKQVKFMFALETIDKEALTKQKLIETLNIIKEKHYHEFDYRYQQNYLGKSGLGYSSIDYVPPKPADVHELMDEWFVVRDKVLKSDMPAIAMAAALSSSFIYLHPFMDGNGRLSRYIIQDTLYRTGVIDKHHSLPLSAGILKNIRRYYEVLNETSQRIMRGVKFECHDNGTVTVSNDTVDLYKHLCFGPHALYLSEVAKTVTKELIPEEIERLKIFDKLFSELNENMDLPEKDIGLIATLLLNNEGKISQKKRKGVLQHIHPDSLDYAEQVYSEISNEEDSRLA